MRLCRPALTSASVGALQVVSRPDGVARNLQYLLLRYHGRRVQMSGPGIDSWLWLFQQAEQEAGRAETAWNTVCVGLVTHPDFYTF